MDCKPFRTELPRGPWTSSGKSALRRPDAGLALGEPGLRERMCPEDHAQYSLKSRSSVWSGVRICGFCVLNGFDTFANIYGYDHNLRCSV